MIVACLYLMSVESRKVKISVITVSSSIVCGCIIWTGIELTDLSMLVAQVIYVLGHVVLIISTLIVLFRKTRRNDKKQNVGQLKLSRVSTLVRNKEFKLTASIL